MQEAIRDIVVVVIHIISTIHCQVVLNDVEVAPGRSMAASKIKGTASHRVIYVHTQTFVTYKECRSKVLETY